jgi:hypothetical protein
MKISILLLACGALLAGCAEGPVHYGEGGEFHGNTPHNDEARTQYYGDHDRDRYGERDRDNDGRM